MSKETTKQGIKVAKAEMALLGKIFESEINQAITEKHLPYQTKSKIIDRLLDDEMVAKVEVILTGRFPVIIRGYQLTSFVTCLLLHELLKKQARKRL